MNAPSSLIPVSSPVTRIDFSADERLTAGSPAQPCENKVMGIRSKIAMLPPAVHSELDRLILGRAFSGYQALAEWLQAKGYYVADDSVQRYGVRLRQQLEAIELVHHQAQALAAAAKQAG